MEPSQLGVGHADCLRVAIRNTIAAGRLARCHKASPRVEYSSSERRRSRRQSVFRPALLYLADRIGTRLRGKSRAGRTVTVRVRFANLDLATRSVTLDGPISATVILAEIAEQLVRAVLADHPDEKTISLLAISVSHLEAHWDVQLERLDLKMRRAASAPRKAWRVGRPTALSIGSAIASDGMLWDMRRWRWGLPVPCPTSFANSPKRTCDQTGSAATWRRDDRDGWRGRRGVPPAAPRQRPARNSSAGDGSLTPLKPAASSAVSHCPGSAFPRNRGAGRRT